jgi:glycosyltransferase involved in cell wall biosynthesis
VIPRVSVIVPAHNAETELPRLCETLRNQTVGTGTFELIVVDDASTDRTAEIADAESLVRLIRLTRRIGPYPARNVAAGIARGELLAFTDADVLAAPDWLEQGIAAFERTDVELIAGGIRIPLPARPPAVSLIDAARHLDQERYARDGYAVTANLWVRRPVFDEIGGFDERLLSGGDGEFGRRARTAGKRLLYVPQARVDHPPRATAVELARKGFRLGIGGTQQALHGDGREGVRPPWRYPRLYLPRSRLQGVHRLVASGHPPGRLKRLQLLLVEYVVLTLPVIAGSVVESWREGHVRRTVSLRP